jgi:hypothetical protein
MKIQDLFESIRIVLTNEEQDFVKTYGREVFLSSLDQHANWVAQNLVRKGMYEISNDNKQLVKTKNVFYNRSSIRQT